MKLSIALVGTFNCDALESSYRNAFKKLGHVTHSIDIRFFKGTLAWWLKDRITHRLTINNYFLRAIGAERYNHTILNQVLESKPNLVLIFGGEWLLPESVEAIKKNHIKVAIINGDNPYSPNYASRPEMLPAAKACDAYFIWSELLAKRLISDNIRAFFLPFAWDESIFPNFSEVHGYKSEVSFIGGWDKERELFLNEVARHFPLKIWGHYYWKNRTSFKCLSRNRWQGSELRSFEAAKMIAHSKINLNIFRSQHHTNGMPDGVIMRTFEVPGAGGFSLATRSGGAKEIFLEGVDGAYFSTVDECLNQIDYYLSHDERRVKMALHAHNVVSTYHRYEHRAQNILNLLLN